MEKYNYNQQENSIKNDKPVLPRSGEFIIDPRIYKNRAELYYPNEQDILDNKEIQSNRLEIPRHFVFGRQGITEYSSNSQRKVRKAFEEYGKDFLKQVPILLCAVPDDKNMSLVIIDGHHRARYAGIYGIHTFPSIICSVDQARELYNLQQVRKNQRTCDTEKDYAELLNHEVSDALGSFKSLPDRLVPHVIPDMQTIDDLKTRFPSF